MKHLMIFAALTFSAPAMCQQDTNLLKINALKMQLDEHGAGYFEFVKDEAGTKDELFIKGKEWVFKTYVSGKAVIQMEDKEQGLIIGNGALDGLVYTNIGIPADAGGFTYRISLRFKDRRYKCTIDNIKYTPGDVRFRGGSDIAADYPEEWGSFGRKKNKKEWDKMVIQGQEKLKLTMSSLVDFMGRKEKSGDRW